jgi:hypothetical protein
VLMNVQVHSFRTAIANPQTKKIVVSGRQRRRYCRNRQRGGRKLHKIPPIVVHRNRPLTEMRETVSGFNNTEPWPRERVLPS